MRFDGPLQGTGEVGAGSRERVSMLKILLLGSFAWLSLEANMMLPYRKLF